MSESSEIGAEKLERRLTLFIILLNLLLTTVAGFILVGRYEARMHQAAEQLARKELELREIEIEYKRYREEAQLSTDTLALIDRIIPKVELIYDPSQSKSEGLNHRVFHSFRNVGQLSIYIDSYKVLLTTEPFGEGDEPNGVLKEGADYNLHVESFRTGQLPAGPSVFYGLSIDLKPHVDKAYDHIYATLFVYYKTSATLTDMVKKFVGDWIQDKTLEEISSGRVRSQTRLKITM